MHSSNVENTIPPSFTATHPLNNLTASASHRQRCRCCPCQKSHPDSRADDGGARFRKHGIGILEAEWCVHGGMMSRAENQASSRSVFSLYAEQKCCSDERSRISVYSGTERFSPDRRKSFRHSPISRASARVFRQTPPPGLSTSPAGRARRPGYADRAGFSLLLTSALAHLSPHFGDGHGSSVSRALLRRRVRTDDSAAAVS